MTMAMFSISRMASLLLALLTATAAEQQQQQQHDPFLHAPSYSSSATTSISVYDSSTRLQQQQHQDIRRMATNDFDSFNALFANNEAYIDLPSVEVDEAAGGLWLKLNNPTCREISIRDIRLVTSAIQTANISSTSTSNKLLMTLQLEGFDINCESGFDFKLAWIPGKSGMAYAYSKDNFLEAQIEFSTSADSVSFDEKPPSIVTMVPCLAAIEFTDLDFDGNGLLTQTMNAIEKPLRNLFEGIVEKQICAQLSKLADPLTNKVIPMFDEFLAPHLAYNGLPRYRLDPLHPEAVLLQAIPEGQKTTLVNLKELLRTKYNNDTVGIVGQIMTTLVTWVDEKLGDVVDDVGGPTGTGADLGINVMMRDPGNNFLDADGCLPITNISNSLLLDSRDGDIVEIQILLDALRICGLDTLEAFQPLYPIGKYTLRNSFAWRQVSMDLDMTFTMKPSKSPAAILKRSNAIIKESVRINMGIQNVTVVASALIAIQQELLLNLPLGTLLQATNMNNILPCLQAIVHQLKLSGLAVTVDEIPNPTVTGFRDQGLQRLVQHFLDGFWYMYRPTALKSIPNIFQGSIRDVIQRDLLDAYLLATATTSAAGSAACSWSLPENEPADAVVDFGKMFGGGGDENSSSVYGDLPRLGKSYLDSMLLAVNEETGMADGLNEMIASFTASLSGTRGMVQVKPTPAAATADNNDDDDDAFSLVNKDMLIPIGIDELHLSASNITVNNLDTFKSSPLILFQPSATSGHMLDNHIALGAQTRPVQLTMRTVIELISGDSPLLSSRNELDVSLELVDPDLLFVLLAKIGLQDLMSLPLRQMTDLSCWLSAFVAPTLDSKGFRVTGQEPALGLDAVIMALSRSRINIACSSNDGSTCSSSGVLILPDILSLLDTNDITSVLKDRLLELGSFFLTSDFTQTYLDRLLVTSSEQCQSNASPTSNSRQLAEYEPVPLPPLSLESLETLAFAALYALETAAVVIFESHLNSPLVTVDPLSAQKELSLPASPSLIDFTNLTASVGGWADTLLEQLRSSVQDPVDDPDLGGRDLGFNVMVRSFLLDNSGSIDFDLKDIQFGAADFELSFDTLRIKALDTMTKLDLLQGIGPQTVRNQLEMKNLRVEIDMIMKSGGNDLKLTAHMELEDIAAAVSLLLAMDIDALGELELGQVIDTSRIFKCVLSALPAFSLPELSFSVGKIVSFGVEGFEDTALAATVTEMTQLIFNDYNETFSSSFAPFVENTVKTILNNWFDYLLKQEANVVCPKFSREMVTEPTFLDFRDLLLSQAKAVEYGATGTQPYGDLIRSVVNIVKENLLDVDPVTGLASINTAVVRKLTESQSSVPGRLAFPGNLFDQSGRIQMGGLDASFSFRAFDAYMENLDTIGAPLSIVDPIMESRSELNNTASFGIGRPLQAGLRFFISIGGNGEAIQNDLDMSLDLDTATVILTALLKISEGAFFSYPLKDLTNTDCLLMMMPAPQLDARGVRVDGHERTAGLAELLVSVTKMNLNIKCLDCSGPAMAELEDLLSTPEASDATTATVNDIFDFATKMLGGAFMQVQVDRMLNQARLKCPSSPDYDPSFVAAAYKSFESPEQEDNIQFLVMLAIAMGIIILALLVITLVVKLVVRRRHRKWLDTASESKVILLYDRQTKEQEKQAELNIISKSMFTSPEVPLWVRVLMPFIILGNIAFFLSGHLSLAATVNVQAQLGGQAILFDNFFEFSMITSTVEIWNAGGKPLAILIVIFSVIWPYTKQSITMGLWFAPPRLISISCRQSILLWLDILGKWSMIDILTLIVTIAGFRVSIQSPDVGFLPDNLYSIDLFVAPLWGVYANLIAQLISQISSHFIIHYHRRIKERASRAYDRIHGLRLCSTAAMDEDDASDGSVVQKEVVASSLLSDSPAERLYQHTYSRPHRGDSDKLTTRRGVNTMLIVTGFALSILVLVGCIIPSFSLEVLGMVGIMVESGQGFNEATVQHSVFSVIKLLFEQAAFTGRTADYIGLGTLSVVLVATVLMVPIALAVVLLYMWMQPLSTRRRNRCEVLLEALQAWQYADVFLVSVVVASWQLGPVSVFMVNAYCGALDETFAQLVYYGIMKEEDAQCFQVTSKVEAGAFVMAAGAVLLALLNTFIMRAVGQYFRDKENEARRGQDVTKLEALSDVIGAISAEEVAQAKNGIKPILVLFTDTFRWFLIRQDVAMSMRSSSSLDELSADRDDRPQDDTFVNLPPSASGSGHFDASERHFSSYQYSTDDNDDDENRSFGAGMMVPVHMDVAAFSDEEDSAVFVTEMDDDGPEPRSRQLPSNPNQDTSSHQEDMALAAASSVVELLRRKDDDQQSPGWTASVDEKCFR